MTRVVGMHVVSISVSYTVVEIMKTSKVQMLALQDRRPTVGIFCTYLLWYDQDQAHNWAVLYAGIQ